MKKAYMNPSMKVIEIENTSIIATSNLSLNPGGTEGSGNYGSAQSEDGWFELED